MASNSIILDVLCNADGATGQVSAPVDLFTQLGIQAGPAFGNPTVTCHGAIVGETGVTSGAVALQLGIAAVGTGVIAWQAAGTPVNVPSGGGATIPAPAGVAGATHARVVVTTPVAPVAAKCTALVTV